MSRFIGKLKIDMNSLYQRFEMINMKNSDQTEINNKYNFSAISKETPITLCLNVKKYIV